MKTLFITGIIFFISLIIYNQNSIKISMLPKCAGQGFYVDYNNKTGACECHKGYSRKEGEVACTKN